MNFLQRGSNFFQKASPIASGFFQKAKNFSTQAIARAPEIASAVSKGLGDVGRILDKASVLGGKIASNPELRNIQSPSFQRGLGYVGRGSELAGRASGIAHQADRFTNPDSYKGGANEANLTDALQRAKGIRRDSQQLFA